MDQTKKQIYSKTYYEKHKERILTKAFQIVQCEICGSSLTSCHLLRHKKTKKCQLHLLKKLNEELYNNNINQ